MSVASPPRPHITVDHDASSAATIPRIERANDRDRRGENARRATSDHQEATPSHTRKRGAEKSGPTWRSALVIVAVTSVVGSYLFITAPPPLAAPAVEPATIEIRAVFAMLEAENDAARAVWTEEIVERGQERGLRFAETWRDPAVSAGPLPALFLRETGRHLERNAPRLQLFLGSRFPINTANRFTGPQDDRFGALESSGAPQFFLDPTTNLETAMFTDRAVATACVKCHNDHKDSPKHDWQAGAIMGATTWMYPDGKVTLKRATELVGALRASIRAAYRAYLDKVKMFVRPPVIGARWPRDGFAIPDEDTFMRELARRSSAATLGGLLDPAAMRAEMPAEIATMRPIVQSQADSTHVLVIRTSRIARVVVEHAGARVFVARMPAGGTTTLRSRPPLRVTVSDPRGIELDYEGKRVVNAAATLEPKEDFTIVIPAERM